MYMVHINIKFVIFFCRTTLSKIVASSPWKCDSSKPKFGLSIKYTPDFKDNRKIIESILILYRFHGEMIPFWV